MKNCLTGIGILLCLVVTLSVARAGLDCLEKDQVCKCEQAWSAAFDGVTDYVIDQELSRYLSQNQVSAADITSGFRTLSVRNRCMLGTVCKAVEFGGDPEQMKGLISPNNIRGGGFPGQFASCAAGVTFQQAFERMENGAELLAGIREQCSFMTMPDSEEAAPIQESNNVRISMNNLCDTHLRVSASIFDRTVSNLIRKDTTRKVIGYFSAKIFSIAQRLADMQEKAQAFATNTNGVMNTLCTISNPD